MEDFIMLHDSETEDPIIVNRSAISYVERPYNGEAGSCISLDSEEDIEVKENVEEIYKMLNY